MRGKISAAFVKTHRTYTVKEAAVTVGASPQTITRWVHENGLPIIEGARPWLIKGSDLKRAAKGTRRPKMAKLGLGEMTCMKCRTPSKPFEGKVNYIAHDANTGRLAGICEACGRTMNLFTSKQKLNELTEIFDIKGWGDEHD